MSTKIIFLNFWNRAENKEEIWRPRQNTLSFNKNRNRTFRPRVTGLQTHAHTNYFICVIQKTSLFWVKEGGELTKIFKIKNHIFYLIVENIIIIFNFQGKYICTQWKKTLVGIVLWFFFLRYIQFLIVFHKAFMLPFVQWRKRCFP